MSKVAVLRTSPETVVEDYGRLMDLAGYREALPFRAQTCLRVNISWHVYMPACSTTPWQMHGVIEKLRRDGYDVARDLIAAQNDTVVVSCREGTVNNHLAPVLERYQGPLQDLLRIQQEIPPGIFAVMDGTIAGEGPGPRAMRPHVKNYILASRDCVAIDAIAAKLMGFDPMADLKFIRLAHEHGLGVGNPSEIEIVGDDIRGVNFGFRGSLNENTFASWGQKLIYWGPLKPLENLLLRSPLVPWSYLASRAYHDGYWYPVNGRPRVREIMKTPWGELFRSYGNGAVWQRA